MLVFGHEGKHTTEGLEIIVRASNARIAYSSNISELIKRQRSKLTNKK
jgi:hypothetical protein